MAKKYSNGVEVSTGFKLSGPNPIDDREQVETHANLLNESSIISTDLRPWIEVITADTGKKYQWNGNDRILSSSWEILGEDSVSVYSDTNTGIFSGGEVTVNGGDVAKFDIAAGSGVIINWTDPENPTRTVVTWTQKLAETLPDILEPFTTVGIDVNGNVVKVSGISNDPISRRNKIILQTIAHTSNVQIDEIGKERFPAFEKTQAILDYIFALGPVNTGNAISAFANDMRVEKAPGKTIYPFINQTNNQSDPVTKANAAQSPILIMVVPYRDGVGDFLFITNSVVDPDVWDDGSGSLVPVGNNQWTIRRLYLFGQTDQMVLTPGQNEYSTLADAELDLLNEPLERWPNLENTRCLANIIVKKGCTDLTNLSTAKISPCITGVQTGMSAVGDMEKAIYDPLNNGYVDEAKNLHVTTTNQTTSGAVVLDLDTFTHHELTLNGDITSFGFSNGIKRKYEIDILKDTDGRTLTIAPDYDPITGIYSIGDIAGNPSPNSTLGRIIYKANTAIGVAEPFDPNKWDTYIKLIDDVEISLSYASSEIDRLIIEFRFGYYTITPIYNVG